MTAARRVAAIDLGTNTVRLLVVERRDGRWHTLESAQRVTRLGEGLAATRRLGETPMARTAETVTEYVRAADALHADAVAIVATSAVRDAVNGAEFAAHLARVTGRSIRVIPGDLEARLALRGVAAGLGRLPGESVVFDIGGGSTEFIRARGGVFVSAISLRLGVVELAERFTVGAAVAEHVAERLRRELPRAVAERPIDTLVGTAGTVTTLAALDLKLATYVPERVQGHTLRLGAIEAQRDRLERLSVDERAALPCLEPGRADLILPGIAVVLATMRHLGVDALVVSDWGLREGLLAEAFSEPDAAAGARD